MYKFIFLLFVTVILISSCHKYPKEVRSALKLAGENKAQLELVLNYFKAEEDTFKYRAACFIIGNMYPHYSFDGERIDIYDQIYRNSNSGRMHIGLRYKEADKYLKLLNSPGKIQARQDIKNITADYLIKSINQACDQFLSSPWSQDYDFRIFCEYILPYRLGHERVSCWRDSLLTVKDYLFDHLYYHHGNVVEFEDYIPNKKEPYPFSSGGHVVRFRFGDTLNLKKIDCSFSGLKELRLFYLNNGGETTKAKLLINDSIEHEITFENTGKWNSRYKYPMSIHVNLPKAINDITFQEVNNEVLLDYMEIVHCDSASFLNNKIRNNGIYKINSVLGGFLTPINVNERNTDVCVSHDSLNLNNRFVISYKDYGFYSINFLNNDTCDKALDLFGNPYVFLKKNIFPYKQYIDAESQKWAFISINDEAFKIVNRFNSKCLTVDSKGKIMYKEFKGQQNQLWKLEYFGDLPETLSNTICTVVLDQFYSKATTPETLSNTIFTLEAGSAIDYAARLTDEMSNFVWYIPRINHPSPSAPSAVDVLKYRSGNCIREAEFSCYLSRAYGIPVTIDFTMWSNRTSGHHWNVVFDTSGKAIRYQRNLKPGKLDHWSPDFQSMAKVYRKTFSKNNESPVIKTGSIKNIPTLLQDVFMIDVTHEYGLTRDVEFKSESVKGVDFAYVCTFDNQEWRPVWWGDVNNKRVNFKNLGVNVAYMPAIYKQEKTIGLEVPFILDSIGQVIYLKPNHDSLITLELNRKYPFIQDNHEVRNGVKGGQFQGSNRKDFSDAVTLWHFDNETHGHYEQKLIDTNSKFKYYRYLGPLNGKVHLNEIVFFDINDEPLIGTPFYNESKCKTNINPGVVFDGDILTGLKCSPNSEVWVGLELDKPKRISKIKFMPRTDGNVIEKNDTYELVYWDKEWVSCGVKVAQNEPLIYDSIPSNALYLLHNLTKGKEERIFTYENDQQIWW